MLRLVSVAFFVAICCRWSAAMGAPFVLSGGPSPGENWHADDKMKVFLNGGLIYDDNGNRPPISFNAEAGASLSFQFIDTIGGCRGHSEIWLHDMENECGQRIVAARDDGCASYPATSTPFDTPSASVSRLVCPAALELTVEPAEMLIPQASGERAVWLAPPAATRYGKTELPFHVRVLRADTGEAWAGARVTLATDSPASAVRSAAGGAAAMTLDAVADGNGQLPLSFLVVDEAYATAGSGETVRVSARTRDVETSQEWPLVDNLAAVEDAYRSTVPSGWAVPGLEQHVSAPFVPARRNELRQLFFDPSRLDALAEREILADNYQAVVLDFLNKLRHDPTKAYLLNGLDYGPVRTLGPNGVEAAGRRFDGAGGAHFATGIYPASEPWYTGQAPSDLVASKYARVLDPWPTQQPAAYTLADWTSVFGKALPDAYQYVIEPARLDPGYMPPYPMFDPHAGYPIEGSGRAFIEAQRDREYYVLLDGPAELLFEVPDVEGQDGVRVGYLADASEDNFVNQAPQGQHEWLRFPAEDGSRGIIAAAPAQYYTLDLVGQEDGRFTLDWIFSSSELQWQRVSFVDVPVRRGEHIRFLLADANACQDARRDDGETITPECASVGGPTSQGSVDDPHERGSPGNLTGAACRIGGGHHARSDLAAGALLMAIAKLAKGRRHRRATRRR